MKRIYITLILAATCLMSVYGQAEKATLHLFSDEMKTQYPSAVYDFLERYLYEVSHSAQGYELNQRMADDKVTIMAGSLSNVSKLSPETPFSMSKMDDKMYEVSWVDSRNKPLLDLVFPIQYELLLGQKRTEIEKNLREMIVTCSETYTDTSTVEVEPTDDGYYRSVPSAWYYVPDLNTSCYYGNTDNGYEAVFSDSVKWYSAANLMLGVLAGENSRRMYVQQNMYNHRNSSYTVRLGAWFNYCRENGITLYFGVEEERTDGLKCLIIAESKSLGFNHLLSVIIPADFVTNSNSVIKAQLNAFIPTQNVKDLYQKYTSKKKTKREWEN